MKNELIDLDNGNIKTLHWRIVFTAGIGFFTDAYDLFIIGVVTTILVPLWHLTISQLALLNGSALAAAAVGAISFGLLSDKFGRKRLYGVEIAILFFGAILAAFSPSYIWLLISRIIVGLGIGGDYPSSAVIVSEYAPSQKRGFLVLLVFAMQAVGLLVGPLLASLLLLTPLHHSLIWRILLGVGAIPAASIFYLRRKIQETPHYLIKKPVSLSVSHVVSDLTGVTQNIKSECLPQSKLKQSLWEKKWFIRLVGTAGAWFLLDVTFYGNGVSSVLILKHLNPSATLIANTLTVALIFFLFAVPGYILAAAYIDRIGRKFLQMFGFLMIAITYGLIALIPHVIKNVSLFTALFGISFFFVNFGPNTTTFLIPSEVYPTSLRARAHGISAALGKVGAFIGTFFLPHVSHLHGLRYTMALLAVICLLGILFTLLLPEMKGKSLEIIES